ncbi:hypothetical protein B0A52_06464 [Exophiala mesophila]|uniref:MARVEL domain-containing protein n=1 Tax=Exophiala mesophila TaxID=212818 RepID=A0A438N261_EXOME|nr:hypothetical protein B0A52_06464 [Exophiala mesophila]
MKPSTILRLILRLFQLVQALVVIGYYGTYLNRAMKADKYADGKWVRGPDTIPPEFSRLTSALQIFAVVVGSISAFVALMYGIAEALLFKRHLGYVFAVDLILLILWIVLTGLFGHMYFSENVEMDKDIEKMKTAAIFDAIGLGLWSVSLTIAVFMFKKARTASGKSSTGGSRWHGRQRAGSANADYSY